MWGGCIPLDGFGNLIPLMVKGFSHGAFADGRSNAFQRFYVSSSLCGRIQNNLW